jgi:hypothetical protein
LWARVPGLTGADADRLAAELGDLPLAIAQAAGFMAGAGLAADEFLGLLRTRAGQLLAQGAPGYYPRSLAAATGLIADRLADQDPAAAELAIWSENPTLAGRGFRADGGLCRRLPGVWAQWVSWRCG